LFLRVVRGRAKRDQGPAFAAHLREELGSTVGVPGLRWAYVASRAEGSRDVFLVLSLWESVDALRATVGTDVDRPHLPPADMAYIEEAGVEYFEVVGAAEPGEFGVPSPAIRTGRSTPPGASAKGRGRSV
jgi:quinol monooxygenase YgiN